MDSILPQILGSMRFNPHHTCLFRRGATAEEAGVVRIEAH